MVKLPNPTFLEEWLLSISSSTNTNSSAHPLSSAQTIVLAWADLRDSLQCQSFQENHVQSLKTLVDSQTSIHVADPQAKLVISILSSPSLSLTQESYPLFLRLLYIWVRKSSRPSSVVVDSAVELLLRLFSQKFSLKKRSAEFLAEGILLLGALSFQTCSSEKAKIVLVELLCKLLEEACRDIFISDEVASRILAGAGYALSSPVSSYNRRILDILSSKWTEEDGPHIKLRHGLMILHMIEWVVSDAFSSHKVERVRHILENDRPGLFAVMSAAGVLRALNRFGSTDLMQIRNSAEGQIEVVARVLVSRSKAGKKPRNNLLLQCVAIALARSGPFSYRSSSPVMCLASALLVDIFPLQHFYHNILEENGIHHSADEVKEHVSSVIYKEAGAITGVFCNQYVAADEESQSAVENLVWHYCHTVYSGHRKVASVLQGRDDKQLISDLEKVAESAFLMVVVFALAVMKHRLNSRINQETRAQIAVKILISFSCMEYFRRMRLPEYMDTIRAAVVTIQENESACVAFVESIPSYDDLINKSGFSKLPNMEYIWSADEVQTARVLFYMRVIPTCIEHLPAYLFRDVVAPLMFLYIGHHNAKVSRYSHTMFTAFISSGKDLTQDEPVSLKEQLIFYYIQRSLDGYPGITPFEGLASGVAALVRHLPAGSPAIFYCIDRLVKRAESILKVVRIHETDLWKSWEGELEPPKKLLDLLLRLLSIADIQVLPSLMKQLAQLIIQLPADGQTMLLDQLYQQIAESDDVIRKPTLISWLQSLSFLCSQGTGNKASKLVGTARAMDSISFSSVHARL